jgi:TPR repeat protein
MGYDEAVVSTIEACPRAVELLGEDIEPAWVGLSCGQAETEGGHGHASWTMAYAGSRDRGAVDFDAEKHGGQWTVLRANLTVDGEHVDLLACERATHVAEDTRSPLDAAVARCRAGDGDACVSAGAMYEAGHLIARDVVRAHELYHLGCEVGHAPACRLEGSRQ